MLTGEWSDLLAEEFSKKYFSDLNTQLKNIHDIIPEWNSIFLAFNVTKYEKVKVVIIGKDPYKSRNEANSLAFSVQPGQPIRDSLNNIFTELEDDLGIKNKSGFLLPWAERGVLLLNSVLTREKSKSHHDLGWEMFIKQVIKVLNNHRRSLISVLWGNHAKEIGKEIDRERHAVVIESSHPSNLSARATDHPFFGSRPFSKIDKHLAKECDLEQCNLIDWSL